MYRRHSAFSSKIDAKKIATSIVATITSTRVKAPSGFVSTGTGLTRLRVGRAIIGNYGNYKQLGCHFGPIRRSPKPNGWSDICPVAGPGGLTPAGLVDSGSPALYRPKPFLRTEGLTCFPRSMYSAIARLVLSLVE